MVEHGGQQGRFLCWPVSCCHASLNHKTGSYFSSCGRPPCHCVWNLDHPQGLSRYPAGVWAHPHHPPLLTWQVLVLARPSIMCRFLSLYRNLGCCNSCCLLNRLFFFFLLAQVVARVMWQWRRRCCSAVAAGPLAPFMQTLRRWVRPLSHTYTHRDEKKTMVNSR